MNQIHLFFYIQIYLLLPLSLRINISTHIYPYLPVLFI